MTTELVIFALPLLLTLLLTPLVRRTALHYGFLAVPSEPRHIHPSPKPRLGGLAVALGFLAGLTLILVLPIERQDPRELERLRGFYLGSLAVLGMGILDDRWELGPFWQFVGTLAAALVALWAGIRIDVVNSPLGGVIHIPLTLAGLFTLFWLLGMMHTVNWLDGVDGLAAGVAVIFSLILFVHAAYRMTPPQASLALLPLALAGACLGFLFFNFHPSRIFLGSSGAYFLGFALGSLAIIGGAKMATALLVLGVPILDVAWVILYRLRHGRSPFRGDRGHLHHRLLDLGLSQRQIVLVFYAFAAFFGVLAVILWSRLLKLVALLILALVALAFAWWASSRRAGVSPAAEPQEESGATSV